jgi:phosphoenolpyruvate synthase/pyruvate phosphate dikinase
MYTIHASEQASAREIGAKAWNLLQLTSKFRVPEFLVITTKACKEKKG